MKRKGSISALVDRGLKRLKQVSTAPSGMAIRPFLHKKRIPVWIDTDPGVDDAIAIALCAADPNVKIVGISVSFGNCRADDAFRNTARIKHALRLRAPHYLGATEPLLGAASNAIFGKAYHVHGKDGLGGIDPETDVPDSALPKPRSKGAVQAIIDASRKYAGRLRLITLGPLTNLALTIRLDPTFAGRLERLYVMGGAATRKGNMKASGLPEAEHNFACDPDSAHIVLSASGYTKPPLLIDWEVSQEYPVPYDSWTDMCVTGTGPATKFLWRITQALIVFLKSQDYVDECENGKPANGMVLPDPLAMCVCVDEGVISKAVLADCTIDVTQKERRGAIDCTIVKPSKAKPAQTAAAPPGRIEYVTQIDGDSFFRAMRRAAGAPV